MRTMPRLVLREVARDLVELAALAQLREGLLFLGVLLALEQPTRRERPGVSHAVVGHARCTWTVGDR